MDFPSFFSAFYHAAFLLIFPSVCSIFNIAGNIPSKENIRYRCAFKNACSQPSCSDYYQLHEPPCTSNLYKSYAIIIQSFYTDCCIFTWLNVFPCIGKIKNRSVKRFYTEYKPFYLPIVLLYSLIVLADLRFHPDFDNQKFHFWCFYLNKNNYSIFATPNAKYSHSNFSTFSANSFWHSMTKTTSDFFPFTTLFLLCTTLKIM